jgi:ubiquinone/menaquinone biosynthesis C-methylase UbiE
VVDIGAGTGISSRAFAARGINVVALEPNQAMLEEGKSHPEFQDRIQYVQAKAEETGLASHEYDALICAQAFHWLDARKALTEFSRILKPGAYVFLFWNERNEVDEFTKSYGDLLRTLPDTTLVEVHRGAAGQALLDASDYQDKSLTCFPHLQEMDYDKLIARVFSSSYSPSPGSPEAEAFEQKLKQLFDQYQKNGKVTLTYECSVYSGHSNPT